MRSFRVFRLSLAVAVTQFVLGRLGLELAIPPDYSALIWPPAGFALAVFLLDGRRLWPGLVIGSLALCLSLDGNASPLNALPVAAISTAAAVFQAWSGAALLRRFGHYPNPLRSVRHILWLFGLGGVVACALGTSLDMLALWLKHSLALADLPATWAAWWGGDCVGVFLFTPLILSLFQRPRRDWARRVPVLVAGGLVLFGAAMALVLYTRGAEQQFLAAQVHDQGSDLDAALEKMLESRARTLDALQAFEAHSAAITPDEFRRYAHFLRRTYPGIATLAWAPRVGRTQRAALEANPARSGQPDFHIRERRGDGTLVAALPRADYYPLLFAEPEDVLPSGLDLGTLPATRALLDQAGQDNGLAASASLTLSDGAEAVLLAAPAHQPTGTGGLGAEPAGFVLAALNPQDLANQALAPFDLSGLDYWLMDNSNPAAPQRLAGSSTLPFAPFALHGQGLLGSNIDLQYRQDISFGGRHWSFLVAPTAAFIAENQLDHSGLLLPGTLLASSLISLFLLLQTGREGELRQQVEERTETLRAALDDLGASEERYRELFTSAMVPMLIIDPLTGAIVDVNGAACGFYGYGAAALKALKISDINTLPLQDCIAAMARVGVGKQRLHFRHRLASGELREVEVFSGPMRSRGQTLLYSLVTDVTERQRLEQERRKLVAAVDQSPISIVITDRDGRIDYVNDAFSRITGYSAAEVIGDNPRLLKSGETTQAEYEAIWGELTAGRAWSGLFRNKRKDGSLYWEQARLSPVTDAQGRIVNFLGIKEDVSERIQSEQRIRDLAAHRQAILDNTPIGIAIVDFDRVILEANEAFARIYGRRKAEILRQNSRLLYADPHQFDDLGSRAYPQIRAGGTFNENVAMRHKDGSEVWVRLGGKMVDASRPDLGVVWTAAVITAARRLEQDLKRSNAELEQFAYVASHDLRQPLRMISSYLTLLERHLAGRLDGEEREFIAFATEGAQRMDRMIVDLLDYARIGRDKSEKRPVDLQELFTLLSANMKNALEEAGAALSLPALLPTLPGNESELLRLFQNLVSNALKFRAADRPPLIRIHCAETEQEWRIAVEDNGIGIAPEHHARLFVLFQRLVSREQYEGNGIGLAACRKICEHHGGRIWLDSVPGQGSTFTVALPKI